MQMQKRDNSVIVWLSLGLILVVAAVAYLPMLNQLGYYRDDWNLIYAGHTQGAAKFIDIYSIDRPFIGYVFSVVYSFLGDRALWYDLAAFCIRVWGAFSFFWLVRLVWPGKNLAALLASLLLVVYPGFLQQPNGIQFLPHQLNMALSITSIAFSIKALNVSKKPEKILLILLAMISGLWSMLMMEYFIGLEGLRLALLWYLSNSTQSIKFKDRLIFTFKRWIPYLLAIFGFLYWRIFIFVSTRPNTNVGSTISGYLSSPIYKIWLSLSEIIKDFFEVVLLSWAVPPYQHITSARLKDFSVSLVFGLLAGTATFLVIAHLLRRKQSSEEETNQWAQSMVAIGIFAVLATAIPIIFAGREVSFNLSNDRFSLPGSAGAVLILVGLLFWLVKGRARTIIPAFLVCIAVMTQYNNNIEFANWWKYTRNFWWQVSWRAPQIEKGTVLIAQLPGFGIEEDYEVWGPANLIYYPIPGPINLSSEVLYPGLIQQIIMGAGSHRVMRTINVDRDYEKTLVLTMPTASSCVQAIDGRNPVVSSGEETRISLMAPYSKIDQIKVDDQPHVPSINIFGPDPGKDDWCYYYEKAALAQQQGDWKAITQMFQNVRDEKLKPGDRVEWIPFVQALAYTGETDRARSIVPIIKEESYLGFQTCNFFKHEKEKPSYPNTNSDGLEFLIGNFCN
jgi:hypothetical protein